MFEVNLDKLTEVANDVTYTEFGAPESRKVDFYINWVLRQLSKMKAADQETMAVWRAILEAMNKTVVLMPDGIDRHIEWVAQQVGELCASSKEPIYPVINEECKSDAWLTGRVHGLLKTAGVELNPERIGIALRAKLPAGKPAKVMFIKKSFRLLVIDDASYSGTQVFNLLMNCNFCNAFDIQKCLRATVFLAGASQNAMLKLAPFSKLVDLVPFQEMPRGDFGSGQVVTRMRALPGYASHIEADPATLAPKPTQSEFATFWDLSYAILPYKIPDSISVPTHVYLALGYDGREAKGQASRNPWTPPQTMRHLFSRDGSITYREIMSAGSGHFLHEI